MTAQQLLERMQALDVVEIAGDILENTAEDIIGLNQAQMFQRGEGSDGDKLPPYRSQEYADYKHGLNSSPGMGNPDYYLSGEMFSRMYARVESGNLVMGSDVDYAPDLLRRGGDPFGLQPSSKAEYIREIHHPAMIRAIKARLGLK